MQREGATGGDWGGGWGGDGRGGFSFKRGSGERGVTAVSREYIRRGLARGFVRSGFVDDDSGAKRR